MKGNNQYLIRFNRMDEPDRVMPELTKSQKLDLVVLFMQKARENKVKCPDIAGYGRLPEYNLVYLIVSYLDGEPGESALKKMSVKNQYEVGKEVGKDISRLHGLQFDVPHLNWGRELLEPYERRLAMYLNDSVSCPVWFDKKVISRLVQYVNEHKHLLDERPMALIHNDIHDGNIIIKDGKYQGIIDFNEIRYGDPFYEHKYLGFNDIVNFPDYCKGILDGYFDGSVPQTFWEMTYLYLALFLITYLPLPKPDYLTEEEQKDQLDFMVKAFHMFSDYEA
jgi:aminoglycoside phosphotransferase (APT) family kinase protein